MMFNINKLEDNNMAAMTDDGCDGVACGVMCRCVHVLL